MQCGCFVFNWRYWRSERFSPLASYLYRFHGQRVWAGLQSMGSQLVRHDWDFHYSLNMYCLCRHAYSPHLSDTFSSLPRYSCDCLCFQTFSQNSSTSNRLLLQHYCQSALRQHVSHCEKDVFTLCASGGQKVSSAENLTQWAMAQWERTGRVLEKEKIQIFLCSTDIITLLKKDGFPFGLEVQTVQTWRTLNIQSYLTNIAYIFCHMYPKYHTFHNGNPH